MQITHLTFLTANEGKCKNMMIGLHRNLDMILCYTALSPFCRKVRMVMDWKAIDYTLVDSCDIEKYPAFNSRAEIPILVDDTITVVNSADIHGYLDRKFSSRELYPSDPEVYNLVRQWEREADTLIDAIVTDVGIYKWADIPRGPKGLLDAARSDLGEVYDRLEQALAGRDFIAGERSVADFAVYVHLSSAQLLQIGSDEKRHPLVMSWLQRMMATQEVQRDSEARMKWWATRDQHGLDTRRINWGAYRLEWFLANGFIDHFVDEVKGDRVLWSVGPNNNAKHSPLAQSASR
jgi:glutathione S-transferase